MSFFLTSGFEPSTLYKGIFNGMSIKPLSNSSSHNFTTQISVLVRVHNSDIFKVFPEVQNHLVQGLEHSS